MSLVQAFIYKDYIVVGGDNRAILDDGTIYEQYKKIYKLNETTIIGYTGSILCNVRLFEDFINKDFTLNQICLTLTYNEIIERISNKFNKIYDFLSQTGNGVHSVVCGWDGSKMTGKAFFSQDDNPSLNGITDITPDFPSQLRIVNCGLSKHSENAHRYCEERQPHEILQVKNIFKDVIDEGIKFDNTINNIITFEKIRRSDMEWRCNNTKR